MAVPSYATDLTDIYTDTDNFSTVGGGRVTATETDDYIQGNNCWSHDPFSSGIEGGIYDNTTAPTITADDCVYVWTKCDVAATLATHTAGGIQIIMGSSATAYDCFYVLGSDDYQYGGWKVIPVDPTLTPSTTVGTPTTNDHFGVRWNVPSTGAAKGYPMKIDAIRYGRSATVTAGEVANPATWAGLAAYDATGTRQWGICQPNDAGVEIQGIVNWGTASTACYFDDSSGLTVIIIDTEWTATDFTQIVVDHASTTFNLDGATIKALGTNNPGQLVFNNASTTAALDNCTFDSIGITTLRAGVTATNNKWKLSDTVTQNGATLDGCTFDKSTATVALVSDDIESVTDCTFNSDGTGHAVNLGTITATDTLNWDNYATGYVTGSTGTGTGTSGNETILVSVNSGQVLTINVGSGYTIPSVKNDGTGSINVVAGQVTTSVTVQDINTDTLLEDATVLVWVTDNTNYFFEATPTSITGSGTTATVTHTGHGMSTGDNVIISGVTNDDRYNGAFSVTVTGTNTYTYTTESTIVSTPASGTIKATFAVINDITTATGTVTDTRSWSASQAIAGRVRKGTYDASPPAGTVSYYIQGKVGGTISTTNGFDTTVSMVRDE